MFWYHVVSAPVRVAAPYGMARPGHPCQGIIIQSSFIVCALLVLGAGAVLVEAT
jgi:hypothetical protein